MERKNISGIELVTQLMRRGYLKNRLCKQELKPPEIGDALGPGGPGRLLL